jgi:uncharacterized membrane protein YraQ (UPF0718 family)
MQQEPPQFVRKSRRAVDWPTAVLIVLVATAAIYVIWRDGPAEALHVVWGDAELFALMLPKVLAGCLIAAFITILLPRETVNRWVGPDSGTKGILVATLAGIILPGGPFTIFPIAGAFIAMGADVASAIVLITSWTLLGINRSLVWEMAFFGFDFVTWRWLAALPLPILAGFLVRLLERYFKVRAREP